MLRKFYRNMNKEGLQTPGWVFQSGSVSGLAACTKALRTGEADALEDRLHHRSRQQWSATPAYEASTQPDNSGRHAEVLL